MKTTNAIKAFAKHGITLISKSPEAQYNRHFEAVKDGYRVIITTQGEDVSTMRVHSVSDHDDSQSDYSAGSYVDTIPQALRFMTPQTMAA